jgi:hypothetical protein
MVLCRYFHKDSRTIQSNEKRSDQQVANVSVLRTFWCTHKHSPVPAAWVAGGAHLLKCGGDLDKCQVPPGKFEDQ